MTEASRIGPTEALKASVEEARTYNTKIASSGSTITLTTAAKRTQADDSPLCSCISPASWWTPNLFVTSAWVEHAPFAFWLTDVLRPKTIVELGCYFGFSYFAFCQAVQALNLDSRCYAIDTWKGDEHTGFYGEEVFKTTTAYNDTHYNAFSQLIRSDFDEALLHFPQGSIDLLHIDGAHSYRRVKFDYENWLSRVSKSSVVLFHDTNYHERGFGVAELWGEVSEDYPHFEFLHGNGLGVLGIGENFPSGLEKLFLSSSDPEATSQIRLAYSRLGMALSDRIEATKLSEANKKISELETKLSEADKIISELEVEVRLQLRRQNYLSALASKRDADIQQLMQQRDLAIEDKRRQYLAIEDTRRQFIDSTSWRVTRPLRVVKEMFRR